MDASVDAAISAVQLDDETAQQRWFDYLRTTADQHQGADWTALSAALTEGATSAGVDSHVVERFLEHMQLNDSTPGDTVKDMMAMSATELPSRYRELAAASTETATEPAAGAGTVEEDPSAWNSFLAEHGKYWDGTDTAWEQFKTWFCYQAEQRGVGTSATGFIEYAQSQTDKVAVFKQYGVTIAQAAGQSAAAQGAEGQQAQAKDAVQDVSAFPEVKPGDSGEWVDYLDRMLTSHGF